MRILLDFDDRKVVVDLQRFHPQSTLSQLIEVAGGPSLVGDEPVFVDRASVAASTPLSEMTLLDGTRVARTAESAVRPVAGWSVSVIAGAGAGTVVAIPEHRRIVAGRSPQADVVLLTESASWNHCTFEREGDGVRVRDSGSTNGTVVDGVACDHEGVLVTGQTTILVGGAALMVRPTMAEPLAPAAGSLSNVTAVGTAPFNRPPRPSWQASADPIIPPAPREIPPAGKFNLIAVAAPLVMAGALVLVLGDLRYALFALLSPVMAIGMHFEQRRRRDKNVKDEDERFAQALADLETDVAGAATEEVRRLHDSAPDLALILRRPALPSALLWQSRSGQHDFLSLHAGVGDVPWNPELDMRGVSRVDERVKDVIERAHLTSAPVVVDLDDAGVVGIVGDRAGALQLARSLLIQAAVGSGPADLTIGVFCDSGREAEWGWAGWLPHTRHAGGDGARWLSDARDTSNRMLRALKEDIDELPTPVLLTVLDSDVLTDGRESPARDLLGHGRPGARDRDHAVSGRKPRQVAGIVIARRADQLPAACTTVIEVGQDAACTVRHMNGSAPVEDVILAGLSLTDAEECARSLARYEDPELVTPGASLPGLVRLPELLGVTEMTADAIRSLWRTSPGVSTPVGLGENGPLVLDIVRDGPHGLVGGTTGSGKSEFLRSLVAGLAARNSPEDLNFILIDFKGGAAFTACERLPHTIGTISNLDEQLADRALRALEAEMERRQRLFAEAGEGIDNLAAYLATHPAEPLPRLLLVIDEFAMLAKEFPDVLASLVSVGAVGRTLGVHMILATQRPAGVVNEDILANTNLRVALRVQSREDSANVIGVPSAASIERTQTGRAYVKLGQDDITPVQTALVTGRAAADVVDSVEIRDVDPFGVPLSSQPALATDVNDANDLDLLIDAIVAASHESGTAPPRQVWPEPLGGRVPLAGYRSSTDPRLRSVEREAPAVGDVVDGVVRVALADDPDRQRQVPAGWDLARGNLLLLGVAGSGTSTTLASIALTLANAYSPDEIDILCLDAGGRDLAPLAALPHTVAYAGAGAGAKEQQTRFLRHLSAELLRRRSSGAPERKTVVLVDGFASLRDDLQDYEGQQMLDAFYRVYADGPAVGIHFAVATTRAKTVPSAMDEVTTQRWIYRLADTYDYSSFGIKGKDIPAVVAGRCVDSTALLQMQIATPALGLAGAIDAAAGQWDHVPAKADVIGTLPDVVDVAQLAEHAVMTAEPHRIPVGLREDNLRTALLEIYEGEHVLIAGPARSGKSTLLLALAEILRGLPDEQRPAIYGIHDRRSPLTEAGLDQAAASPDEIPALLASLRLVSGPVALLIDDAERVEDPDQTLASLLAAPPAGLLVIAAGRSAELRGLYGHWTKTVRKARCGVLLQPDTDYDGELLGVKLPRAAPVAITTGRGYACVGGDVTLIQSMSPSGQPLHG